jgi:hypothetical protein
MIKCGADQEQKGYAIKGKEGQQHAGQQLQKVTGSAIGQMFIRPPSTFDLLRHNLIKVYLKVKIRKARRVIKNVVRRERIEKKGWDDTGYV